jgi:hypothetical protein
MMDGLLAEERVDEARLRRDLTKEIQIEPAALLRCVP